MSAAVIEVDGLRKTYREGWIRRRSLEVLKGLSFTVGPGEIFGLLGPNGAGKTTFIKILLGIVRASGGTASLLGHSAGSRRGRRHVGYLPENLRIARHHTGHSALDYYGWLSGLPLRVVRSRASELLPLVGLAQRAGDPVSKYSKGMLQRLGLAQALLHDPQLVILDEPTDGLDPVGRSHVRNVLQQLKQRGKTVFVNSHILQEVELICDRVAILDKGLLRYVGPVHEAALRMATVEATSESGQRGLGTNTGRESSAAIGSQTDSLGVGNAAGSWSGNPSVGSVGSTGVGRAFASPTDGGGDLEVQFELRGGVDAIRNAFAATLGGDFRDGVGSAGGGGKIESALRERLLWVKGTEGGADRVTLRLSDQSRVDAAVDALRAAGVSLVGLSRRRLSLEDAFLAIVETVEE
jgi:ABC-type multidrug transport system ATPase subunit